MYGEVINLLQIVMVGVIVLGIWVMKLKGNTVVEEVEVTEIRIEKE